jgi:hypothetical protein
MRARKIAGRGLAALAVPVVLASVLAGPGTAVASAATCLNWAGTEPPSPGTTVNHLNGVVATSACHVIAAGQYWNGFSYQTLVVRWNGTAWKQQPSANPAGSNDDNVLHAVAATSASNAWAVGYYGFNSLPLIERWNGTTWAQVSSPSPGSANQLNGVAATSASNAWAVGSYYNGTTWQTLAERWNGSTWKQVPTANPSGQTHGNLLLGVTALSASNAWAVGYTDTGTTWKTLVEHWNGTTWKQVPSPTPGGATSSGQLRSVAAVSASNIWAAGNDTGRTLIEHWNGSTWKAVPSPTPNGLGDLQSVTATSASNVWAAGESYNGVATQTLVERWNGSTWTAVPTPNPAGPSVNGQLSGITATSASNVWAVGNSGAQDLAVHCC